MKITTSGFCKFGSFLWLLVQLFACSSLEANQTQTTGTESQRTTLRIRLGVKDRQPTDWNGKLVLPSGEIESLRGWRWTQDDSSEGGTWKIRTNRRAAQTAAERNRVAGGTQLPVNESGVLVTIVDCPAEEEIKIECDAAQASFKLADLGMGTSLELADGGIVVEQVPTVQGLAATTADEDYPAVAVGGDGTVACAYLSFTHGRDFQGARERVATPESEPITNESTPVRMIEQPGDFAYLAQPTGGEQIYLQLLKNGIWSEPVAVTDGKLELYRPAVAMAGDGRIWVFYSAHQDADENLDHGNWELMARSFASDGSVPSEPINISSTAGTDFMPAATCDSQGQVHVVWIGAREGNFHVFHAQQSGQGFSAPKRVSRFEGNEWEPAITSDSQGNVAIAWDTFDKGDYDVYVSTRGSGGEFSQPEAVAASLAFEVRPSITYDLKGRLWIAYEFSGDQWGKDFGALKKKGIPLYQTGRSLAVKVLDKNGQWYAAPDVMEAMPDARPGGARGGGNRQGNRTPITSIAPTYPKLACDSEGAIWLAFRGKPGENWRVNVGSVWFEYVTRLGDEGWSDATFLPHTNNILDNRPALARLGTGSMLAVFSGDGRGEGSSSGLDDVHLPGSSDDEPEPESLTTQTRRRRNQANQDDPNNNLRYAIMAAEQFKQPSGAPSLVPIQPEMAVAAAADIQREREDIQRMRDYRVELGNESLRIWRGEFHRHTELSPDGGGDGGLLDMWRYAIDAGGMDWIGDGDHDYGIGREYSWWTTQKAVTLFTLPERFVPVYSYERSVRYPEGHRNCMFAYRGVRSLPRLPLSSPDEHAAAPDTNMLYKYLHYFGGLCASHTCATDMGTDWRNNDPQVEPFVEIYQGDRNNYERPDSPRSAVTEAKLKQSTPAKESLGGWRPKGFVNLALLKGYRLAFQASSDHISTHLSYCNVLVTEPTREGILDAIRKRRVYGATDNIIADVRCQAGETTHFMGEEFTTDTAPTLAVHIIGAQKIAKVTIIKDDIEVYSMEPNEKDVQFQWTDPSVTRGETSYYYVRGEQVPDLDGTAGELVWASPMWILVK
ncbi:MAG: exo-alpha-sialidase [Planctomycetales bacterium]|nr:exo-alpha-sialidase [Planctomycetales bacterium]